MIHKKSIASLNNLWKLDKWGIKTRCGRPEKLSAANENDGLKK